MKENLKNYVCEICGGDLREIGEGHFQCPYCRTEYFKETSLPDELILDLHSANRERSLQRFEDALSEYDRIIAAYPDCFDAYWGATLSDYGIQYEKDYDGKMIPTVHRFSEIPVFENGYYLNALRYCKNENEKARIEKSADEIERIRTEIKKTVGSQEPYDIFLCYKESPIDGSGGFTPEFYWANDLYIKLSGAGHRVFFAKESLPAAKGDYEAHIFPALRSAKLMLILTTDVRHVESVWVKNEWSRFLRFSKENPLDGKRFKVIYRGFKPEQLPRELRKEQALNQDSIDWAKQLFSVVEDTFRDKKKEEEERRRREADEQAARFARMLEEERKKWAAEAQKSKDEERARREAEDKKKRDDETRKTAEENERRAKEDERIRELERRLTEERKRTEAPVQTTSAPTVTVTSASASSTSAAVQSTSTAPQAPVAPTVDEKTVSFGSYPQDKVTDTALTDALNRLAGKLPTKSNSNGWTPYKYTWDRSGTTPKLMWYTDVTHEGEKYRGVYFVAYRSLTPNAQRDNGYGINTAYWFKFQPVLWKTLEEKSGKKLLLSSKVIDSQQFYHSDAARRSGSGSIYPNNYEKSDVRAWLNGSFAEAAFNETENSKIVTTAVSCAASTTAATPNKFAGGNVKDKLFLLSFKETANADYGFLTDALRKDTARAKAVTDYALCQGASARNGNASWWLRSPNATLGENALCVDDTGFSGSARSTEDIVCGIAPAMWLGDGENEKKAPTKKPDEKKTENTDAEKTKTSVTDLKLKNGIYTGEVIGDVPNGKGVLINKNGDRYEGEWKNGHTFGNGKISYKNGNVYEGEWALSDNTVHAKMTFANGDVYEGDFKGGIPNGIVKVTCGGGEIYEGEIKDGMPNGIGKFTSASSVYEGGFKNSKRSGYGREVSASGDVYEGEWNDNKPNGKGKIIGASGNVYDGEIKDGKRNGKGKYTYVNGNKYEGQFKDDKYNGKGKITYKNGDVLEGHFNNNELLRTGKMTYANGSVYNGELSGGIRNGFGKMEYSSGDIYEGSWRAGKRFGKGKLIYKIVGAITYDTVSVYEGEFENDYPIGRGKLTFVDGSHYMGDVVSGRMHGNGARSYKNGEVYSGEWRNNKKHGKGLITYQNGDVFRGEWEDDQPVGKGVMTYKDGKKSKGKFVDGVFKKTLF